MCGYIANYVPQYEGRFFEHFLCHDVTNMLFIKVVKPIASYVPLSMCIFSIWPELGLKECFILACGTHM